MMTRRQALRSTALAAAAFAAAPSLVRVSAQSAPTGPHTLPALPYAKDALEPHFDTQTMEIHHDRHHKAYVDNLNKALADYPDLQKLSVEQLLSQLDKIPEKIRTAVRNHGGGHANHTLFWQSLRPATPGAAAEPGGRLAEALGNLFTNAEEGQEQFLKTALGLFGSGWVWISINSDKSLRLETLPNQDSPLMFGRQPLVGLDVWEHAYYLKYQNKRADYVKAFYNLVNWEFLEQRYEKLTS